MNQYYTTSRISPHREITPEGFLLCRGVVISRTGTFDYKPSDTGLVGKNGVVKLTRTEDELFSPETMRSFEGKDVTIGHGKWIDADNWSDASIGSVNNVRRQGDALVADLLIKSKEGIDLIKSGRMTEVSCGYDARPIQDSDGYGHQVGIVGNHVALVDKARCGESCRILDGFMEDKEPTLFQKLLSLFRKGDEDEFKAAISEVIPMEDADVEEIEGKPFDEPEAAVEVEAKADDDGEEVEEKVEERVEDEDDVPPVNADDSIEGRISVLEHEYQEMAQKLAKLLDVEKAEGHEELKDEADDDHADEDKEEAELASAEEAKQVLSDADDLCEGRLRKPMADGKDGGFTKAMLARVKKTAIKQSGFKQFGDSASLEGKALDVAFKACVALKRAENNPRIHVSDGLVKTPSLNEINKSFWEK